MGNQGHGPKCSGFMRGMKGVVLVLLNRIASSQVACRFRVAKGADCSEEQLIGLLMMAEGAIAEAS